MGNGQEIQTEKIHAEIEKIKKETEKFEEEIKELRGRKRYSWKSFIWWRDLLGITSIAASLVYGVLSFIDQQRERNEFEVTKEVVTLVQQLSKGSEQVQGNTAILLSAYGEHALSILLNTLTVSDSPGLLTALELIGQDDPKAVIKPLTKRAKSDISGVLKGEKHKVRSFRNYIKALGAFGPKGDMKSTIEMMNDFQVKLDCKNLQEQGDFKLDKINRRAICQEIANECEKIRPGACQK